MTTDEIVAGIDRSLTAIAAERDQILAARAALTKANKRPAPDAAPRAARPRKRPAVRRGKTGDLVLGALDVAEPRTAGDINKITSVGRAVAGATLTRLAKQGKATKADRGYLRAVA